MYGYEYKYPCDFRIKSHLKLMRPYSHLYNISLFSIQSIPNSILRDDVEPFKIRNSKQRMRHAVYSCYLAVRSMCPYKVGHILN